MKKTKYPSYQDYVIKDGEFVGEFEQMYQDFGDPWHQTEAGFNTKRAIALHLIQTLSTKKVLELGCGLGYFTNGIRGLGVDVLGVDISATAIEKAKFNYPECQFLVGDILDREIYTTFQPELIIMPEITWYVLDKLDAFISFLRQEMKGIYLLHILTVYPPGVQKIGCDKFTNIEEILSYFKMEYVEWGNIYYPESNIQTYFLGKI